MVGLLKNNLLNCSLSKFNITSFDKWFTNLILTELSNLFTKLILSSIKLFKLFSLNNGFGLETFCEGVEEEKVAEEEYYYEQQQGQYEYSYVQGEEQEQLQQKTSNNGRAPREPDHELKKMKRYLKQIS